MIGKSTGVMLALLFGLLLTPAALADDGVIDDCIVTYVAQTEDEPITVEGKPEPVAEPVSEAPAGTGPSSITDDSWKFSLTRYLWAIAINGDLAIGPVDAEMDADFGDILSVANMAFAMRGEAWQGPLGFTFDVTYLDVEEKTNAPIIEGKAQLGLLLAEVGFSYMFHWPLTEETGDLRVLTIEPIVGVRYVAVEGDIDVGLGPISLLSQGGRESWIEPWLGLRSRVQLSDRWSMAFGGNVGGFGIGSDFTWVAFLGVDFKITELLSAKLGYKWMDIDYSKGSGRNRFELDATLQGLWLGLSFNF